MPDSNQNGFALPPLAKSEENTPPDWHKEELTPAPTQMYVAPKAPKLIVRIPGPDDKEVTFQFEKGQLELPHEFVEAFDKLIAKSDGLRPLVRKVDLEAAKRMVAEIEASQTPRAAKGQFASSSMLMKQRLKDVEAQMQAAGIKDTTYVKELGDANMQLQQAVRVPDKPMVFSPEVRPPGKNG